jgi:ankyrin repeat protein
MPITLFVDALDEAGAETASELAEYFHELNNLVVKSRNAKICISCRHYPVASNNISLEIHVEDENHNDIAKYVEEKLDTERPDFSAEEYQALKKTVVGRASGSFMWARLSISMIIRSIRDGESLAIINDELCKVPSDLGDAYEHILKTIILPQNRKRTLLLMQWVCFAERPLSVTELRYAIASDNTYIHKERQFCKDARDFVATDKQMQKQLTSWSGGLVEARRHSNTTTVQFIHQTVNDFLRSQGLEYLASAVIDLQPRFSGDLSADIVIGQSHDRLRKSCVNYLRLDEVLQEASLITPTTATTSLDDRSEKTRLLLLKLPFILYAAESWYLHAEKAEGFGILQEDLVQQLNLAPQRVFQSWISISRALYTGKENPKRPEMGSTILHIASGSNLRSIIQVLLNDNWKVDTRDDTGNTALHYAARWGHTDLVKMLLDARAELDAKNKVGSTALERAAVNGHEDTLRLLLHRGADVNNSTGQSGSALQAAAGEEKYIVVQLLLDSGANVNTQGGRYGNALQAAAQSSSVEIVELLLRKGANVNAQGGNYGNALQAAARCGSVEIVELLLRKGADVNTQGGVFSNALQAAVQSSSVETVELLLRKGADVNAQGGNYGNALQAAARCGSVEIVELLLRKGADVNTQGGVFGNVLQAAGCCDSVASAQIVELLKSKGAK